MRGIQALIIFLLLAILVGGIATIFYLTDITAEKTIFEQGELKRVDLSKDTIARDMDMVISDLLFLADHIQSDHMDTVEEIAGIFMALSNRKMMYDQIRLIDESGMEIVRVDFNNGAPAIVPREKLQNKKHRYYFEESFAIERGEVYVSPFDLNIERGEVEKPFKPMIRAGTPIVDKNGEKKGIVIVNYLGARLINSLKKLVKQSESSVALLNSGGYWLHGPEPESEWGFMFEDKKDRTFGAKYPDEWARIINANSGQFTSANGLFTFSTIFPVPTRKPLTSVSDKRDIETEPYFWKVVSILASGEIGIGSQKLFFRLGFLYAVLVGLLALSSWLMDRFFGKGAATSSERLSPFVLLLVVAVVLFFAELLVMLILPFFEPLTPLQEAFMDSSMLFILVLPTLYFLLFRPLVANIDERNLAEIEREKVISDLDRVNVELKDFAYIVSHDLKAPLRAISSLAGWIKKDNEDKLDAESRENLSLMLQRTKRMNNLIQGILEYSRAGRINTEPELLDCNQVVNEVTDAIHPPGNIKISIDGALPSVIYDQTRLIQVFQNLISNAINHMDKPKGEIIVSCRDKGDSWEFSVKDNGPGIEERHFERIFKVFQSLKSRDEQESTGIGLALVKKIVESHGGHVRVESKVSEGSEFCFTIKKEL